MLRYIESATLADPLTTHRERYHGFVRACPVPATASERIRQARRAQQLADYEQNGYPLALVRMLNAHPEITLDDALDGYSVRAQRVA